MKYGIDDMIIACAVFVIQVSIYLALAYTIFILLVGIIYPIFWGS